MNQAIPVPGCNCSRCWRVRGRRSRVRTLLRRFNRWILGLPSDNIEVVKKHWSPSL